MAIVHLHAATSTGKQQPHELTELTCSTEVTVSTPSSTNISAEWHSLKHRRAVGTPSMAMVETSYLQWSRIREVGVGGNCAHARYGVSKGTNGPPHPLEAEGCLGSWSIPVLLSTPTQQQCKEKEKRNRRSPSRASCRPSEQTWDAGGEGSAVHL
ncbi:hypothetical protein INR49_026275 [Caranx melampygus]|nr:hypothetical protein INR49_026275 [Caranx melampygus]